MADDDGRGSWFMSRMAKNLRDDNEAKDLAHKVGNPIYAPMAPEQAYKRLRDTGSLKYRSGGKVNPFATGGPVLPRSGKHG